MVNENPRYSVLYKLNVSLLIYDLSKYKILEIPNSDVISIAMIHNYDNATFPIIRLRLYTDLTTMFYLTENPDNIHVSISMYGNVYRLNSDEQVSTTPVSGATNIEMCLKGYIENKNTPTSIMDNYDQGVERENDLNVSRKVPIELYCFDDKLIHYMRTKVKSIYKDMTITSIIETIFRNQGIVNLHIDSMLNQQRYDQVLIPNLNINETLSFFESMYGMYEKGTQVYGDIDKTYITNTDVNTSNPLLIYVESYKNNSDMGGMRKVDSTYNMNTKAENVSILSETEIEKIFNAEFLNAVNVNSLLTSNIIMSKLYSNLSFDEINKYLGKLDGKEKDKGLKEISESFAVPDILHKSKSDYILSTLAARVVEKMTQMDVSGVGFDVGKLKINTRYNLIFDTPIRGRDINSQYRATYVTHVFTNLDSDLFIAQTTMHLCSN